VTDISVIENNILENYLIDDRAKTIDRFWDMFVIDALIANTDRHNSNWGFMEDLITHELKVAPIYDCGSSLFPLLSDEEIGELLKSEVDFKNPIHNVYSCLKVNNKRINYFTFLSDMQHDRCNAAVLRMYPSIDMENVLGIVNGINCISDDRRKFYCEALQFRYEKMLTPVYQRLVKKEKENDLNLEKDWSLKL